MKSTDGLKRLLSASGIAPDSESACQLISYLALLEKWNRRINLTATTAWKRLEPQFQEGIWASRSYPPDAISHLDIGSGAGFPAIILGILIRHIRLEMVESRAKRSIFLETAIRDLGIAGALVHHGRLREFLRGHEKIWDCITWKGLKLNTEDLLQLRRHAHPGTQFWMFHGRQPAVEEPGMLEKHFRLLRSDRLPGSREWALSVYVVGSKL